jgi:hypothetical protein
MARLPIMISAAIRTGDVVTSRTNSGRSCTRRLQRQFRTAESGSGGQLHRPAALGIVRDNAEGPKESARYQKRPRSGADRHLDDPDHHKGKGDQQIAP